MYAILIDGTIVPGNTLSKIDLSNIQISEGVVATVEYIPSISKMRSVKDAEGHGYNFITETAL